MTMTSAETFSQQETKLPAGVAPLSGGISINEDCSNFLFCYVPAHSDPMACLTIEGLQRFADYYCQGQTKEVIFNANCQKVSYGTQTRFDAVWAECEFPEDGKVLYHGKPLDERNQNYVLNSKHLHEKGINQYSVWFDHIRAKGYSPWVSMRMNDMHGNTDDSFFTNRFWVKHPELRLGEGGYGLDYAQPEVRKFSMELVHEYLTIFDVDGIEIDWTRFPEVLRHGRELADAHCITEFMREVRKEADAAAERLGHPVKVGARIFSRPDECLELGYDYRVWLKEKLVDMLVPTNFWPSTDSDMPMETWRQLVGPDVILGAGIELWTCIAMSGNKYDNPVEMAVGYAAQFWHRGADRMYFFNHMVGYSGNNERDAEWLTKILAQAGSPDTAYAAHRRHVVTFCVSRPITNPKYATLPMLVLASKSWRLNVGGGTKGRHAMVILGVLPVENDLKQLTISVNGVKCAKEDQLPEWFTMKPQFAVAGEQRTLMVRQIPLDALQDGYNDIRLDNDGDPVTINWVEILLD